MLFDFVTRHRGIFVTIFVLPVSMVFKLLLSWRNRIAFMLRSAPEKHDARVAKVQKQVRAWKDQTGGKIPMCTARPGWQAMSLRVGKYKKTHYKVAVDLSDILEINEKKRTVRVQPMVNMGQMTASLNSVGWTLAVVPELDSLTVGGLINGFGIESSSHRYGLFQHICTSFEIVMADGELKKCSPDENSELYYAIPWSYGSLGFLVAAELKIIPAKKYVQLKYEPIYSKAEFLSRFREESQKPPDDAADFVEGLMYSEEAGVLMTGIMTNERKGKLNTIGKFWKPWFYEHVRGYLKRGRTGEEFIPLRDYYHRHTRSLFWEMQEIVPFGNHPLFRYFLGWMAPPEISLLKMTETKKIHELYEKNHMDQDFLVPIEKTSETIDFLHHKVQFYPLWLCPTRIFSTAPYRGMVNPVNGDTLYVDIGVYGQPKTKGYEAQSTHRILEDFIRKNNGYQALYADTYQSREELREMFDHRLLDQLRKKYECSNAFPEPYDKVSREARK